MMSIGCPLKSYFVLKHIYIFTIQNGQINIILIIIIFKILILHQKTIKT